MTPNTLIDYVGGMDRQSQGEVAEMVTQLAEVLVGEGFVKDQSIGDVMGDLYQAPVGSGYRRVDSGESPEISN